MASKYKQVKVNFLPEDLERISKIAKSEGVSNAEFLRRLTESKIHNAPKPKVARVYKTIDPKLLYELRMIGNNLNQLTLLCNMKKTVNKLTYQAILSMQATLDKFHDR